MDAWVFWAIAAVIFAVGEIIGTSFYLAPFSGGAALAAVLAAAGAGTALQLGVFIVASMLLLTFVRPIARRHLRTPPQLRTGTAALVGKPAVVLERIANDEGSGCVRIDGEVWTARAYDDSEIEPGAKVHVMEIRGATALVTE